MSARVPGMFGRKLIPLSTLLLLAACGRYDGGSLTAQHPSGLVQQVDLEGNANKPADVQAKEEAERLARAQAERDRLAAARAADEKRAAEKAAAKAAEEAAAAEAAAEAAAIAEGEAAAEAEAEAGAEGIEPGADVVPPAGSPEEGAVAEVVPAEEIPVENPEVAAEGSVAALLAEEASLAAEQPAVEEPVVEEPVVEEPAAEEPAVEEPAAEAASEPVAALEPAVEEPAVEEPAAEVEPAVEAAEPAEAVPAAEESATGVLPPTWMPGSVPPCDPNDLAATPLRELSLKQTFGTGDEARAMLRSTGGDEFVVQKGSVVGPDGARVVRVAPGEVLLAVIQFDMSGQPVLVQQSLRMDSPR